MKRLFAVLALVFSAQAQAQPQAALPLTQIQEVLAKPAILCGRFDQSKQLLGMKKPLLSHGRFCVLAGKGVLWRTEHPFPNTLRLTRNEILQTQGERIAMRVDARQEPALQMVNGMLFSLLAGDLSQLQNLFEGQGSVQGRQWAVALKAREPALARVIAGVSLEGGQFVRQLTLHEGNRDRTLITFSALQTGANALTAEEAAQF